MGFKRQTGTTLLFFKQFQNLTERDFEPGSRDEHLYTW